MNSREDDVLLNTYLVVVTFMSLTLFVSYFPDAEAPIEGEDEMYGAYKYTAKHEGDDLSVHFDRLKDGSTVDTTYAVEDEGKSLKISKVSVFAYYPQSAPGESAKFDIS